MIKTRLLKLMGNSGKYIVFQVLSRFCALILQILIIYIVAGLSATAIKHEAELKVTIGYTVLLLLLALGKAGLDRLYVRMSFLASVDVKKILRRAVYEKLLDLGSNYREFIGSAEITQLMTEGVEQLETYYGKYLSQFFYSILAPITLFVVLFGVDRLSATVLLLAVPLIPITIVLVMKVAKRLLSRYWGRYAVLADSFLDNLNGLTTLKIYGADGEYAARMDDESEEFRKVTMKVLTMQLNSTSVMDIIAYGGAAVGMVTALSRYMDGSVDVKGMLMIILLAAEFFLPMRRLGSYFHVAMNGMTASDRIFSFLDIKVPKHTEEVSFDNYDIELKNVSFTYTDGRAALDSVNASFKSGRLIMVTGASGSGKSTLANVLSGLNRGYKGEIGIGGNELFLIPEDTLNDVVTVVKHDSFIFKGTVRDNMKMACPGVSDTKIEGLLKKLRLDDVLTPDSIISEGASDLSGGQRQRLALARAILFDSPIYIFDEAASNIDKESEEIFLSVIKKLAKRKTVIFISHRLKNALSADTVFFMKDGKIISEGTHEGLMSKNKLYREMFDSQMELEKIAEEQHDEIPVTVIKNKIVLLNDSIRKEAREDKSDDRDDEYYDPDERLSEDDYLPEDDFDMDDDEGERRNIPYIVKNMLSLLKPLIPVMCIAVILGTVGAILAISLTVLAGNAMITGELSKTFIIVILSAALLRGLLHYGEQYFNHFIAFKILAVIRHKLYEKLRTLAPAVLERKDKGNLIAMITSDVEKLEVFYAHTVSPVMIAFLVSAAVAVFVMTHSLLAGTVLLLGFYVVGVIIPFVNGKRRKHAGMKAAKYYGEMNSIILESLYGLDETIQYGDGLYRLDYMEYEAGLLRNAKEELLKHEEKQNAITGFAIEAFSFAVMLIAIWQVSYGAIWPAEYVLILTLAMGSFGPVVALSSLSNDLSSTFASADRVIALLNETPKVKETPEYGETGETDNQRVASLANDIAMEEVSFSYGDRFVLQDISFEMPERSIISISGKSGSGKSTLLRLMMRFWDPQDGEVYIGDDNIKDIPSAELRRREALVAQDTFVFNESVRENILVGRLDATDEEVEEAAKKAAIHDFIMSLPDGYDTKADEAGSAFSDGEKQRIGLARAFLHDSDIMLFDEPTSNLDALNEGMILKSLREIKDKTVIIVSHRESTLGISEKAYRLETVDKSRDKRNLKKQ